MLPFLSKKPLPGPAFFGIGAPRCGTTWLFENLKAHPDIWLPPIKELRFFKGQQGPQAKTKVIEKTLSPDEIEQNAAWLSQWQAADPETLDWYRELFHTPDNLVSGDISPIYCTMDKDEIQTVAQEFPTARIILMLRDPIARDWSHAKFKLHYQEQKPAPLSIEAYQDFLDSDMCERRSAYVDIIKNWRSAYSNENMFVGFYDQITEDPDTLLSDICAFLDLPYQPEFFAATARTKVHASQDLLANQDLAEAPPEILAHLAQKHLVWLPELMSLTDSPYVTAWCQNAQQQLATP